MTPTPDPIKTMVEGVFLKKIKLINEGEFTFLGTPDELMNDLTQAINNELLRARQELFDLYGTPVCDNLHHIKKHQHRASEECPVVKRLTQLKQSQTEGGE